jgi:hypothetical protein
MYKLVVWGWLLETPVNSLWVSGRFLVLITMVLQKESNTHGSDIQLCQMTIGNHWFFHETRWFFEGFEIAGTHGAWLLIFSHTQNRQFFDS